MIDENGKAITFLVSKRRALFRYRPGGGGTSTSFVPGCVATGLEN